MNDENRNPADPNPPIEPQPTAPIPDQEPAAIRPAPVESVVENSGFQIPVVETEPVFETPVEPEPEPMPIPAEPAPAPIEPMPALESESEPVPAPVEPMPEPITELEFPVEEAIIVGAPSRPGDKPEKPESEPTLQNYAPATPAMSSANDASKNKTGFRPDGVTPLDAEEKVFAAIGYISFLCLLPLLARRDSAFAQHHAWQSVVIFIGFMFLLIFGGFLGLAGFISFLMVIEFIGGFVLAYKGDWFKIPVVYDLSLKLKEKMPSQNPPAANTPSAN